MLGWHFNADWVPLHCPPVPTRFAVVGRAQYSPSLALAPSARVWREVTFGSGQEEWNRNTLSTSMLLPVGLEIAGDHFLLELLKRVEDSPAIRRSAWLPNGLFGSATRPAPHDVRTLPGRTAGTWVNVSKVSGVFGMTEEEVEAKWKEIIE